MQEPFQEAKLEIFDRVHRYLVGDITVAELEDWIVPHLGHFLVEPEATAADLAGTVELGLAELSDGLIDEQDFKLLLNEFFLTHPNLFATIGCSALRTGADNSVFPPTRVTFGTSQPPARYERIGL